MTQIKSDDRVYRKNPLPQTTPPKSSAVADPVKEKPNAKKAAPKAAAKSRKTKAKG
jgi:hypothetical protein